MTAYDQYLFEEQPKGDDDIVVYHSGFCSTTPNYSSGLDVRNCYIIHYVHSGQGEFYTKGQHYALRSKQGFLIEPQVPFVHAADPQDPWSVCWLAFFGRQAERLLAQANLYGDKPIFCDDGDSFLESRIMDIYHEIRGRRNINTILGHFHLFMGRLIDIQNPQLCEQPSPLPYTHFDDAMNFIHRRLHTPLTVGDLSSYLHLDASQVYRIFKAQTGTAPLKYITALRMEKACDLLSKTDLSVNDIAKWLSFEYPCHFSKQFKRAIGMTPTQYRQSIRV